MRNTLITVALGLLFGFLALFLSGVILFKYQIVSETRTWKPQEAVVQLSEVVRKDSKYCPHIQIGFGSHGRELSTELDTDQGCVKTALILNPTLNKYQVGKTISVVIDAGNPAHARGLELLQFGWADYLLILIDAFVIGCLLFFFVIIQIFPELKKKRIG